MELLTEFFKILWILITLIPYRVEMWIDIFMDKYGEKYEEYWDMCYDFVKKHEIRVILGENYRNCKVYFENLWIAGEEESLKEWFGEYVDIIILKEYHK